ncbi:hypothetical protein EV651_106128 [Kribbella sp. VKM Ac-2571]|uniref:hypothetical protein n=1 Tax=Kribbella sp. VKM Ac-2571 TaxID=2512222 RepID=UPI00105CCD88|nr:hypothetical protein [Kribbella sp. VKM Ac-2571]TDO62514.1 hypothetical protein EV651_106128 [Kribbella sp. VKM Ac-2571]
MTAQHHDVQHHHPADEPSAAPDRTDPLGPIQLPMRHKVGARAMALVGIVGLSAAAAAVVVPDGLPFGTT